MLDRRSGELNFAFNPDTLAGTITQTETGKVWAIDLSAARGVVVGSPAPTHAQFPWTQTNRAVERLARGGGRGLRPSDVVASRALPGGIELSFRVGGADFRVTLTLTDRPDELLVSVEPLAGGASDLVAADLPGPVLPADGAAVQVLVAYRHQGRLYTGSPGALETDTPDRRELLMPDGRHRLRFFGVLGDRERIGRAGSGYVAIMEENADALISIRQADDGAVAASVLWAPSMGTLAYPRTIRYRFQSAPTAATLAKAFREYAKSAGLFKSLKDKIAERPIVGRFIGATACFIGYEASELDYVGTFRRLRQMGHAAFYVFPLYHINAGFGEAFAGLKLIDIRGQSAALRELGAITGSWTYVAGLPDRPDVHRLAMRNADGTMVLNWQIGTECWPQPCTSRCMQLLSGQRDLLGQADVHHFDTTASSSLLECCSPAHPLDRRAERAARVAQFQFAAAGGSAIASEGVKDWAVPHYDMGSNKEIPLLHGSPAFRAAPIQHLVYHDALFMLWWEADTYDIPYWLGGHAAEQALTDMLYGDMPLIMPVGRQYRWAGPDKEAGVVEFEHTLDMAEVADAARRAATVAGHFARVATEEMTGFDWLSDDGTVQQTQFGNGTSVIANFGAAPFRGDGGTVVPPGAAACV